MKGGVRNKSLRRLSALIKKETLQVMRDPAALAIAFVLPVMLLFLFAFAVSLDVKDVKVGIVLQGDSDEARSLAAAFNASRFLEVLPARHIAEVEPKLLAGELKAIAVIPADFATRLLAQDGPAAIQIITDASNANTANYTAAYLHGTYSNWLAARAGAMSAPAINLQLRFWFNPELQSKRVLVPGSIALVMTLIGTLLTALLMSREWERGTMEAMMATPASMQEILISKLVPYFLLGTIAVLGCTLLATQVFGVHMQGSLGALMLLSCVFLLPALGQGLLISTVAKSQFLAAEMAVMSGFLPAMLLSGFLFDIESMPKVIQVVSYVIPARHYVSSLQTIFLAGDVWPVLLRDMGFLVAIGVFFFTITRIKAKETLD